MIPRKPQNQASKSSGAKIPLKQSKSQRIKQDTPRPHVGIHWNDVKTGFRHFKIKRWNSIGSWVLHLIMIHLTDLIELN